MLTLNCSWVSVISLYDVMSEKGRFAPSLSFIDSVHCYYIILSFLLFGLVHADDPCVYKWTCDLVVYSFCFSLQLNHSRVSAMLPI